MIEKRRCPNCGAYLTDTDAECYVCGEIIGVPNVQPRETKPNQKTYAPVYFEPEANEDFVTPVDFDEVQVLRSRSADPTPTTTSSPATRMPATTPITTTTRTTTSTAKSTRTLPTLTPTRITTRTKSRKAPRKPSSSALCWRQLQESPRW